VAYSRAFKMSRYGITGPFSTLEIAPRMKWSVFTLFGRVMNSNEEFCSDWLFFGLIVFKGSCVLLHRLFGKCLTTGLTLDALSNK